MSFLTSKLPKGIARVFRLPPTRERALREMDDEARFHLEMRATELRAAGLSERVAEAEARRRFGDEREFRLYSARRAARQARWQSIATWADSALQDTRLALRSLRRSPGWSAALLLTIALAVAGGCATFALVDMVLLRPLPYPHSDRIVGLWHTGPGLGLATMKQSPGTYAVYSESASSFQAMGIYVSLAATLTYSTPGNEPERVHVTWATPSTFGVLSARPLLGRVLTKADDAKSAPAVAIINEHLWETRFGSDSHVIGRTMDIDGVPFVIVGVMPATFAFPDVATPVWAPIVRLDPDIPNPTYLGSFGLDGIGRLRPGVTPAAAQRELQHLLPRLPDRFPEDRPGVSTEVALRQTKLTPVVHLMQADVVGDVARVLWLIAATVVLLVLVAFSNVASLTLVRVEARHREFAVRAALGASTARVWQSVLAESAIVAAAGGVLGFALAAAVLRVLVRSRPIGLPRLNEVHVDSSVVLAAAALTGLFVATSVAIAALRIRPRDALRILRTGGRTATSGRVSQRLRGAFVAAEVALSLVLLAGSGVLARSVLRLRAVHPGFDPSNVFTFWTSVPPTAYPRSSDVARLYSDAIDRMQRLPGVISAAATARIPLELEGWYYRTLIWADDGSAPSVLPPAVDAVSITSGYFGTMHIPLIAGRSFDDASIRAGANEAVASRAFVAHFWHDSTGRIGAGKRVRAEQNGPWYTIVGVVGDVRDSTLVQPPILEVYFAEEPNGNPAVPASHTTGRDLAFVVRSRGSVPGLPRLLERELHALDPNLPVYRPASMADIVTDARSRLTLTLLVLATGAGVTLLLGLVGLYGVIAYVVSLRSREISIRIALGLAPHAAARLILRQGQAIVAAGAIVGIVAFVAFARLLTSLTFEVSAVDGRTIVAATMLVLTTAMLATWIPARRAALLDPAEVLKDE